MAPVITWLKFIVLFLVAATVAKFGRGGGRIFGHSYSRPHHYPVSTGFSGYGSGGRHSYPASTGVSGNNNLRPTYHQQPNVVHNSYSPRTEVHHHYHYNPPQQIAYGATYHPVYQGHPPIYVYEYRNSGSRFDNLLTGLALYNLGRNSHYHHYSSDRKYSSPPGEICKLRISKGSLDYEETGIDCNLMSSFIWDEPSPTRNEQHLVVKNTTQVTVTKTVNGIGDSSVSTVTKTSNTVEDALKMKGPSIQVTSGMTCSIIRTFRDTTTMRRSVDCGLLQEYAQRSLQRSVAQGLSPLKTTILHILFIVYWLRDIL